MGNIYKDLSFFCFHAFPRLFLSIISCRRRRRRRLRPCWRLCRCRRRLSVATIVVAALWFQRTLQVRFAYNTRYASLLPFRSSPHSSSLCRRFLRLRLRLRSSRCLSDIDDRRWMNTSTRHGVQYATVSSSQESSSSPSLSLLLSLRSPPTPRLLSHHHILQNNLTTPITSLAHTAVAFSTAQAVSVPAAALSATTHLQPVSPPSNSASPPRNRPPFLPSSFSNSSRLLPPQSFSLARPPSPRAHAPSSTRLRHHSIAQKNAGWPMPSGHRRNQSQPLSQCRHVPPAGSPSVPILR